MGFPFYTRFFSYDLSERYIKIYDALFSCYFPTWSKELLTSYHILFLILFPMAVLEETISRRDSGQDKRGLGSVNHLDGSLAHA
jgi:hypothetical protein